MFVRINVCTGPMFSGKSEDMKKKILSYKSSNLEGQVLVFVSSKCNRSEKGAKTNNDEIIPAIKIDHFDELLDYKDKYKVIIGDECQFFGQEIISITYHLAQNGIQMHLYGLTHDYKQDLFGHMAVLGASQGVLQTKFLANCGLCGGYKTAEWTIFKDKELHNKLVSGKIQIFPGGKEHYTAYCTDCMIKDGRFPYSYTLESLANEMSLEKKLLKIE